MAEGVPIALFLPVSAFPGYLYLFCCCCLGLRLSGPFFDHFFISIGVTLKVIFGQSYWWDFMGVTSDISRRHSYTEKSLKFCLLESFCSYYIPWVLGIRLVCKYIHIRNNKQTMLAIKMKKDDKNLIECKEFYVEGIRG